MSIYKINNDNTFNGAYPPNYDNHIPDGFTSIEPLGLVMGEYYLWNGVSWDTLVSTIGQTYYRESDGVMVIWENDIAPTGGYQTSAPDPLLEFPTWDGLAWIENVGLRRSTYLAQIVCDLPNGDLVKIIKRERLNTSLEQLRVLGSETTMLDGVTYRETDLTYILAYFEYETQRIENL